MKKVRIGVFGGGRGKVMVDQLLNHPDAELVAVCDKYEPILTKCKETAESKGVELAVYTDFEEFIKHDMDAVVLANYANEHAVYAVKCMEAGKHVMSEVLPGETPAQLVKLIETVEKTGLIYSYAENYCYMKAPFEMWKRYRRGDIGEIQYAEGEYIHDCSSIWPDITYGERDHWRNRMFATFYCTHSCGPLITISGLRAVKVVGFETNLNTEEKQLRIALPTNAGIEMITLENGAVIKSIHGGLKMEPGSVNYQVYGTKGMMESKRYRTDKQCDDRFDFNIYLEGPKLCKGEWEHYAPTNDVGANVGFKSEGHGGSDFYTTHCFIEKILGRPDGDWCIDVYTAANMGMCGIMAWRSVLAGNEPMDIPDFRNPEEREAFRDDVACCTPEVAGDALLPHTSHETLEFPDEVYEEVRKQWLREDSKISDLF
ncbi:MAG: Gfo/Idh/MocA family oxidoreductase [Clostridia bacterium]|nr:Gfo/Idh/MocA family oxidoreductase [Clostridia bacterium]